MNLQISVEEIQQFPREPVPVSEKIPPYHPPRIYFKVSSSREGSHSDLECWIKAQGALAINQDEISFLVDSTPLPAAVVEKGKLSYALAWKYMYCNILMCTTESRMMLTYPPR